MTSQEIDAQLLYYLTDGTIREVKKIQDEAQRQPDLDRVLAIDNIKITRETHQYFERLVAWHRFNKRLLIFIAKNKQSTDFPAHWVVVPTKKEAIDYIALERMQRALNA